MARIPVLGLSLLLLAGCAATPVAENSLLEDAPVRVLGMQPLEQAAKGGRTVLRLFSVDEEYWPVVEFIAEPRGGPVTVTTVNVPGRYGARKISAPVDPELWRLAIEDLATLRSEGRKPAGPLTVDVVGGAALAGATVLCTPVSWFVMAEGSRVSTPGMPRWDSCANRQGAMLPGLYGLAVHSLAPCDELEPQVLDVRAVSRCLQILGERRPAVDLANTVTRERERFQEASDDLPVIEAHFSPETRFRIAEGPSVSGLEAFRSAWNELARPHRLTIGLSTYQGLSADQVEVRGEAFYVVAEDAAGRPLPDGKRELWFAPYHQVWAKTGAGWTIREFVVARPVLTFESDPLAEFLRTRAR